MSNAAAIEAAPGTAPTPSLPPNQTLYIKNLNPKINKQGPPFTQFFKRGAIN
jgi:hypothetical protein